MSIADDIAQHLDKEMSWLVKESAARLFRENDDLKRGRFCEEIGRVVGEIMIERLGTPGEHLVPFTVEEFGKVGLDSIMGMSEGTKSADSDAVSYHVAQACVAHAFLRSMGVKSQYAPRHVPGSDYWPFGQEGGFCNPRKLKELG